MFFGKCKKFSKFSHKADLEFLRVVVCYCDHLHISIAKVSIGGDDTPNWLILSLL